MKETMNNADLEHKKTLARMEQKFFNNKVFILGGKKSNKIFSLFTLSAFLLLSL